MTTKIHDQPDCRRHCFEPWSIERQVRFLSGLFVLIGLGLGCVFSMTWLGLSAFIALGMVLSAVTNSCAFGNLLQLMPWNRDGNKIIQ